MIQAFEDRLPSLDDFLIVGLQPFYGESQPHLSITRCSLQSPANSQ
jgi:hypothetical protein